MEYSWPAMRARHVYIYSVSCIYIVYNIHVIDLYIVVYIVGSVCRCVFQIDGAD